MKKFLLVSLISISAALYAQRDYPLIPRPAEVLSGEGHFFMRNDTKISYNRDTTGAIAEFLAEKLSVPTGYSIARSKGDGGVIRLLITDKYDNLLGKEGYRLNSNPSGVKIEANTCAGLFYGCNTLLQLFPAVIMKNSATETDWKIPALEITDYPRFRWRGIMLDVARNFFNVQEVKRFIDQIAALKFNRFHWHLTDDEGWRIEIKSLPRLTEIGACRVKRYGVFGRRDAPKPGEKAVDCNYYTHEDIRDIVKYASEKYITIVPEIDVPGHSMAAVASYPELSCTQDTSIKVSPGMEFAKWFGDGTFKMFVDNTLDPSNEKVYEFLDKVFGEIAELFPGPYIHVGGDECYKGFWEKDSGCIALMEEKGYEDVEQLQGYFMSRVDKILSSKGKKLIGWDEILDVGISEGATVMSWRGIEGGKKAAEMGHDVIMTPTSHCYLDYNQGDQSIDPQIYAGLRVSKTYSFEPVPEGADTKYILGGQGNLWSEQVPHFRHIEYMLYPRAWALSEIFWSKAESKDWESFSDRMLHFFERYDSAQINYSKAVYDPIVKVSSDDGQLFLQLFSELSDIDIYYTLDNTMPDNHSPLYSVPVPIPDGPVILRTRAYREGKPVSHMLKLEKKELLKRAGIFQ